MKKFKLDSKIESIIKTNGIVNLSGKKIDEVSIIAIIALLKRNSGIRSLDLANNQLGDGGKTDKGVALLAAFLIASKISIVNLDTNNIGKPGGGFILDAVQKNSSITHVSLKDQKVSDSESQLTGSELDEIAQCVRSKNRQARAERGEDYPVRSSNSHLILNYHASLRKDEPEEPVQNCCTIS